MHSNEKNIIIKDFFSESEIEDIYRHVSETPDDKKHLVDSFGHVAYFSGLPDNVIKKIEQVAAQNYDKKIRLEAVCYARYSLEHGIKPKLFPHYDDTFEDPRLTVDIQLRASKPWAIVVEGRPYVLENNQALTFSGTHQIHWREKTVFESDDYVDMIFCHFSEDVDNLAKITQDHHEDMEAKQKIWNDHYDLLPDPYMV